MGLSISRRIRERLELEGASFSTATAERLFEMRRLAALLENDGEAVGAAELEALGQLEEALRAYLRQALGDRKRAVLEEVLARLTEELGDEGLDRLFRDFADHFLDPIAATTRSPQESGRASRDRLAILFDWIVLSIVVAQPATRRLARVLHSDTIVGKPRFERLSQSLSRALSNQPGLLPDDDNLVAALERPFSEPDATLGDALRWMLEHWLGAVPEIRLPVVTALDLLAEEERPRFPPGPGPIETPTFEIGDAGVARYGKETDWMAGLVLAAKNSYVWLDQMSKRAGRRIERLDQIPESELEQLSRLGINGLWLIGLWERSPASRRIKRLCGNPEAAASAYSLRAYRIAADLGGDAALDGLQQKAARFGIRLAADMVPNHTGIDSDWLIEHPDWFLSTPRCPYPSYRFSGPDLSSDPRIGIFLEDHYYDRTDAAVVFKRVDRRTGEERFVYHGNDGTGTPWNDTAQIDYLNPEARAAVADTILEVAQRFPIVRFDAAMTLAKKHIQRLWHPEPGSAGAIPSRAERAMETERFDSLMPREFWRDVVDRVSVEAPDTLLLAEAFWLMEPYFVRQLGVHRVYNSAFMNMLRDGENASYRGFLREARAFDPQLLERYVNFLSNPDEETAAEQFGTDDRYFGACVLLATLPGLPMFAHGQLEGLSERYGMEYRRSYRDEAPNPRVLERHRRQITPLLGRRTDFAGTRDFELLDLTGAGGSVFDDVIAFANGTGTSRTVVAFNHHPVPARGCLRTPLSVVAARPDRFLLFEDRLSGRQFLRTTQEVASKGLEIELSGFESVVLSGFREVPDIDQTRARLREVLGLSGSRDLAATLLESRHDKARGIFETALEELARADPEQIEPVTIERIKPLLEQVESALGRSPDTGPENREGIEDWPGSYSRLLDLVSDPSWPSTERMTGVRRRVLDNAAGEVSRLTLATLCLSGHLAVCCGRESLDRLAPGRALAGALARLPTPSGQAKFHVQLIDLAVSEAWLGRATLPGRLQTATALEGLAKRSLADTLLGYNARNDRIHAETFDAFLSWRALAAALPWLAADSESPGTVAEAIVGWWDGLDLVRSAVFERGFALSPTIRALTRSKPLDVAGA